MLAVMKAGGAFVPLDPSYPISRLQALALSVDAKLLLHSRQHLGLLATVSETVLAVDDQLINQLPDSGIIDTSRAKSSNAAYVIFTSGSTGEPKVSPTWLCIVTCRGLIFRREL
jgi:non-ribosomal peptide synthetase component F